MNKLKIASSVFLGIISFVSNVFSNETLSGPRGSITYNSSSRPISVTGPNGKTMEITYQNNGVTETGPGGNSVTKTYSNGYLTGYTASGNDVTYDSTNGYYYYKGADGGSAYYDPTTKNTYYTDPSGGVWDINHSKQVEGTITTPNGETITLYPKEPYGMSGEVIGPNGGILTTHTEMQPAMYIGPNGNGSIMPYVSYNSATGTYQLSYASVDYNGNNADVTSASYDPTTKTIYYTTTDGSTGSVYYNGP